MSTAADCPAPFQLFILYNAQSMLVNTSLPFAAKFFSFLRELFVFFCVYISDGQKLMPEGGKNKMKKRMSLALALVLALALLAGCGNSYSSSVSSSTTTADTAATEWYEPEESYDDGYYESRSDYSASQTASSSSALESANVKVIYTASMELETTEFDASAAELKSIVERCGGWFEQNEVNNYSTYRYAYYTVRVPAESFEDFCAAAGGVATQTYYSASSDVVSEDYYDIEARLATQQTKLARLQELLAQAENMEDIITIESAISETELNIESLTGSLRHYDSLIDYSTVTISLREVYRVSDVEQPAIGFWAKLGAAFRSGYTAFVTGIQSAALSAARNWVGWLVLILIVAAAAVIIVRRTRARKSRRPLPPEQESSEER